MSLLDTQKLKEAAGTMRAIAHPLRLSIMQFIDKHKSINVNKIYNTLKLEQSITSQHLRILRSAELVIAKRKGKFIFYSLNYQRIKNIVEAVEDFLAR